MIKKKTIQLAEIIHTIKRDGIGHDYDCLMGISGGLDSAYLAYVGAKKMGT